MPYKFLPSEFDLITDRLKDPVNIARRVAAPNGWPIGVVEDRVAQILEVQSVHLDRQVDVAIIAEAIRTSHSISKLIDEGEAGTWSASVVKRRLAAAHKLEEMFGVKFVRDI